MLKKKILICDDSADELQKLNKYFEPYYDVVLLDNYRYLVEKVDENSPVHLVYLDLGFNDEYVGHTILPLLYEKFPKLKVIIYSSLLDGKNKTEDLSNVIREVNHSQVVGYASPLDTENRLVIQAHQVTGTSQWIKNGQLWILHISDPQFGGAGLKYDSEKLASKVWDCLSTYRNEIEVDADPAAEDFFDFPELSVITGDLTERARPSEFDETFQFAKTLGEYIARDNSASTGILGCRDGGNILFIPGNHDINWDISYARGTSEKVDDVLVLKPTELDRNKDYLHNYSWLPYNRFARQFEQGDWHIDPGYKITDLSQELHVIFISMNSSLWDVNHFAQKPGVPQRIFSQIRKELNEKIDSARAATRILLVHHTLDDRANDKDQLYITETPDIQHLIETLSVECGISMVLTGHIHKRASASIDTGSNQRTLLHVGAGTLRSSDADIYDHPQFNLVRLYNLSPDNNKFGKCSVYTFAYDGIKYVRQLIGEDGRKGYKDYDLKYPK